MHRHLRHLPHRLPASGPVDVTSFVATAAGFAADSALFYDFGLQLPSGKADLFTRSATDSRFTFAPRVLAEGTHTLFVCARGAWGWQSVELTGWP